MSFPYFIPELFLAFGIVVILIVGLINKSKLVVTLLASIFLVIALLYIINDWSMYGQPATIIQQYAEERRFFSLPENTI